MNKWAIMQDKSKTEIKIYKWPDFPYSFPHYTVVLE